MTSDAESGQKLFGYMDQPAPGDAEAVELISRTRGVSAHLPEYADPGLTDAVKDALSMTDARRIESRDTFLLKLDAEQGKETAKALIQEAKAIARRDPKLVKALNKTGAGDSAPVLARFVELALAERKAKGKT